MQYEEGELSLIAVMWWDQKDKGWVRATYCTNKPIGGYKFIMQSDQLNDQLIQSVAGGGMYLPDNLKKKFFPGKKNWSR